MIGKWGFSLLPFYLGIIPIFANNNYTLTSLWPYIIYNNFLRVINPSVLVRCSFINAGFDPGRKRGQAPIEGV